MYIYPVSRSPSKYLLATRILASWELEFAGYLVRRNRRVQFLGYRTERSRTCGTGTPRALKGVKKLKKILALVMGFEALEAGCR